METRSKLRVFMLKCRNSRYLYPAQRESGKHSQGSWYLWYFASAMLVCFGRNNGKYIVYVITAILLLHALFQRRRAKKADQSGKKLEQRAGQGPF